MFLARFFVLVGACSCSASSEVLGFLPSEIRDKLSRHVFSGHIADLNPELLHGIPERFHSVVLGDFIRKKERLVDTVLKRILYSGNVAGVFAEYHLRDVLSAFIAESSDKCMYWWLPEFFRDNYDTRVIQRKIHIEKEMPTPYEFRLADQADFLGRIIEEFQSCEPLVGHFVLCSVSDSDFEVVDLSKGCGITFTRERSHEVHRFFPESRAVLTASPGAKFSSLGQAYFDIGTLFMGEAAPIKLSNLENNVREIGIDHIETKKHYSYSRGRLFTDYYNVKSDSSADKFELKIVSDSNGQHNRLVTDNIDGFIKVPHGKTIKYGFKKVCVGSYSSGFSIFSYEKWLQLPETERFIKCEDLPRPDVFKMPERGLGPQRRHDRDRLREYTDLFASIYDIPYPRFLIHGTDCKVPAVDVPLFAILKERLDSISDSDEFKTLVAEVWKRQPLLNGIPIDEIAKSLGLSVIDFLTEISDNNLLIKVPLAIVNARGSPVRAEDVKLNPRLNATDRLARILQLRKIVRDDKIAEVQEEYLNGLFQKLLLADVRTFQDFEKILAAYTA